MIKTCVVCGKQFETVFSSQKCCSHECRHEHRLRLDHARKTGHYRPTTSRLSPPGRERDYDGYRADDMRRIRKRRREVYARMQQFAHLDGYRK